MTRTSQIKSAITQLIERSKPEYYEQYRISMLVIRLSLFLAPRVQTGFLERWCHDHPKYARVSNLPTEDKTIPTTNSESTNTPAKKPKSPSTKEGKKAEKGSANTPVQGTSTAERTRLWETRGTVNIIIEQAERFSGTQVRREFLLKLEVDSLLSDE